MTLPRFLGLALFALVLLVPPAPAVQGGGRARAVDVKALPPEQRLAHARAWLVRALEDINEGAYGARHFDTSWVVGLAMSAFSDEEMVRATLPARVRMPIGARAIAAWCHGDSFGRLRVVKGETHEHTEVFHLWDDLAREPWILWLNYRPQQRNWRIRDVTHLPSAWTLWEAVAGDLVEPLGRYVEVRDEDLALAPLAKAREAARDWRFDEMEPFLEELRALELQRVQRSGLRALETLLEIDRGADPDAIESRANMDGGYGSGARAVCLALVEAGRFEPAREKLESWIEVCPSDAEAFGALAKVVAAAGETERAIELAERAGKITQWDGPELILLDELLGASGEADVLAHHDGSPHADRAFETLVRHWLYGGRRASAVKLIDQQRRRDPSDPNVAFYSADLLRDDGAHAQAAALLIQAFERAVEIDELDHFHDAFVEAMDAAGKGVEGYRAAGRSVAAFEALSWGLWDRDAWSELLALCDEHDSEGAGRAPLDLWRAHAHAELGQLDEAIAAARRALVDGDSAEEAEDLLFDALFELGGWEHAYDEFEPHGAAFGRAASALLDERRGADLAALLEHHRPRCTDPVADRIAAWECDVAFLTAPAAEALALFEARRDELVDPDESKTLYRWEDRVVRLLVRSGRMDQALDLALAIDARDDDPLYLAIVRSAGPRPVAAVPALGRCLARAWTVERLSADWDLGPALERPEAHELRAWLASK